MFEKQTYTEGAYSLAGVKSIWNDDTYASYILEAATSTGMSPYFIAARAALESGYGTSKLATGAVPGYAGYYNLFGIGAKDSNPLIGGAETAKNYNWNSKRKALIEGAAWIKQDYVGIQQYTPYFIKYCFIPGLEWHQYMTDINAPKKDAQNQYKAHLNGGTLNSTIEFVIPVFD
jgi:beta-N-acetylglucosaminidase